MLRAVANILPEGVKGKSFIERGVTPMEERYIGNAKMFSELEKEKLLSVYNNGLHYRDITNPLYEEKQRVMILCIVCSLLTFIRGCVGIFY